MASSESTSRLMASASSFRGAQAPVHIGVELREDLLDRHRLVGRTLHGLARHRHRRAIGQCQLDARGCARGVRGFADTLPQRIRGEIADDLPADVR
jgi:hypothetical protein